MKQTNMKHNIKRFLAMALAVVMIIGMVPMSVFAAEETTTVYLMPDSTIWATDGAWFAAYYWNDSGSNWTKLTDEDNDGYYAAEIPAGYSNIIFTRNDPAKTDLSWDSKWNQTGDLTIAGNNNCYTITGWDNDTGVGTWSHKCIPGAAATCTTDQICTVCSGVLEEALGHTPGAEATCTTAQTCTVCGDELAAALGHDYVDGVCSVCEADEPWYDADATEYHIANKDELTAFAAAVEAGDSFAGKTVYLDADIDLYEMDENGERVSYAPIGINTAFEGTFDGQDHIISGLYQSGWAFGYEWGSYGSLGLFSQINNATIKNLTILEAECLVEGGDVAAIAGSATGDCVFENINILASVLATYNNGCAGIIGWAGAGNYTFKNIFVDEYTVVAGLWGSFDSSLGGIMGQLDENATAHFENVEVSCRLDAYNDVTASYQWYSYRMCGMLIGRVLSVQTIDGTNYPDPATAGVTIGENVVVNYGTWANYHYLHDSSLNKGCQRVEPGYAYDGYEVSEYPGAKIEHITFDQIFGGPQSQKQGYYGLAAYEGVTVNYPVAGAAIGETTYDTIAAAVAAAQDGDTITVLASQEVYEPIVIEKNVTLDLNGYTVQGCLEGVYPVVRIQGNANVTVRGDVYLTSGGTVGGGNRVMPGKIENNDYVFVLGSADGTTAGNLTIEDGSYFGNTTVASVTKGTLNIEGGYYEATPYTDENGTEYGYRYTLNCIDANYADGSAKVVVTGGTFYGFDPDKNLAEGEGTDFVPKNCVSTEEAATIEGEESVWIVTKTAEPVYVAEVVETGVQYESLQDALNACTNGETVKLLVDITYEEEDAGPSHGGGTGFGKYDEYNPSIIYFGGTTGATDAENQPSNVNAVLDLNGFTITNHADAYMFLLMDNAKVTFTDSVGTGSITTTTNAPVIWAVGTDTLVTIEGGMYTTANAEGLLWSTHGADLVITGGEFATTADDASLLIIRNSQDRKNPNYFVDGKATITVTGGTYHGFDPEVMFDDSTDPFTQFNAVAEGYKSVNDAQANTWTVRAAEYVAEIVETGEKFESLQEAMNACANGGTVRLIADITVDGSDITSVSASTNSNGKYYNPGIFNLVGDVAVTVDLNGHNITYHGHADAPYTATYNKNYYYNEETGAYEVNSCTIAHGLFLTNDGADLTIVDNTGTATVDVYGLASAAYSCSPGSTITIEGGTWNNMGCETCGGTNIFLYTSHGGELYIEGGYFAQDLDADGNSYLIVEHGGAYANSVIDYAKSKIEITGGTFAGMNPEQAHYFEQTADNKLVTGTTTNVVAAGYFARDNGDNSWTVLSAAEAGYVAYNVNDEVYFTDLSDALDAAEASETVQLIADTTESIVVVPADVTFDLNGNVVATGNLLSFGTVIDTAAEAGGVKIDIDSTSAFTKLQPENGGYLPIYDTADGTYKFFAYQLVNKGAKAANGAAKFGIAIIFENAEAYNVLANTTNSGMTLNAKLTWTGMSVPYVDYQIPESAVKQFAANAYTQLTTTDKTATTYAITLTVSGLTNLESGDFVAAEPSINTIAEVGTSNEAIVYTIP